MTYLQEAEKGHGSSAE